MSRNKLFYLILTGAHVLTGTHNINLSKINRANSYKINNNSAVFCDCFPL